MPADLSLATGRALELDMSDPLATCRAIVEEYGLDQTPEEVLAIAASLRPDQALGIRPDGKLTTFTQYAMTPEQHAALAALPSPVSREKIFEILGRPDRSV